jgi:maleylacetate reductase
LFVRRACPTHPGCGFDLAERSEFPVSLAALGMPHEGIALAADMAVKNPSPNPRPL